MKFNDVFLSNETSAIPTDFFLGDGRPWCPGGWKRQDRHPGCHPSALLGALGLEKRSETVKKHVTPIFWIEGVSSLMLRYIAIFRDFPYNSALFGLAIWMTPAFFLGKRPFFFWEWIFLFHMKENISNLDHGDAYNGWLMCVESRVFESPNNSLIEHRYQYKSSFPRQSWWWPGGGFQIFLELSPRFVGVNDPIWAYFSMGLAQPPTRWLFRAFPKRVASHFTLFGPGDVPIYQQGHWT